MKPMELRIPAGDAVLDGEVGIPEPVHGVVVFAHSDGSSRRSPRNQIVAERLWDAGLATVLVDPLTPDEERADALRFNIALLAHRVTDLTDWVAGLPGLRRPASGAVRREHRCRGGPADGRGAARHGACGGVPGRQAGSRR